MLELTIPEEKLFDEKTEEFINVKETHLRMEHSLSSVRRWESVWHKPFLDGKEKTTEELLDYMHYMCLDPIEDPIVFMVMRPSNVQKVIAYINDPMTATWFSNNHRIGASLRSGEVITAEIIYYWMFTLNVPLELETWHLNQLLTLLKVINIKNGGEKKISKREAALMRSKLNADRKKRFNTKG